MIGDRKEFIRLNTRLKPVPHVREISLHVAEESVPIWQKTEEELDAIGLPPPYWAFAWAGGQALARYVLDDPGTVAGKRVLDLAAGSGLVAIAAAMAGAAPVTAIDIDAFTEALIGKVDERHQVAFARDAHDLVPLGGAQIDAGRVVAASVQEHDAARRKRRPRSSTAAFLRWNHRAGS